MVTWTLLALNALVFVWDRGGAFWGSTQGFLDLTVRPKSVTDAILGRGDTADLGTLFTAMFLHGNIVHLVGNLVFLGVFGPNVEAAVGSVRFVLFYLFWGVCAFGAQIFVQPHDVTPVLGASGAIGGVLGAYFLLFPTNKIKIVVPPFFWWQFNVVAYVLLGAWFLFQILFPQDGIATWAHAGGFAAGLATILVLGGRKALIQSSVFVVDEEFEDD